MGLVNKLDDTVQGHAAKFIMVTDCVIGQMQQLHPAMAEVLVSQLNL